MVAKLTSGEEWEDDPQNNVHTPDGRSELLHVRAKANPQRRALAKRPAAAYATEIYGNGMERVAYTLGSALGLPIPGTYLEEVLGHPSTVQDRVPNARTHHQVGTAPMMASNVTNLQSIGGLAVLFDIWMANTDRHANNLLYEPMPDGAKPGKAIGSKLWLIDHGQCGLFPAWKWDANRDPHDIPLDIADVRGELIPAAEDKIRSLMPKMYRQAFVLLDDAARQPLLDAIRNVEDDAIDQAVNEIPAAYFTTQQATTTASFLKARRDVIDKVVTTNW